MSERGRGRPHRRENAIFTFSYKDTASIWREKYTGTADREQARRLRQQFLEELSVPDDMANLRLNLAVQRWNGSAFRESQSPPTIRSHEGCNICHAFSAIRDSETSPNRNPQTQRAYFVRTRRSSRCCSEACSKPGR